MTSPITPDPSIHHLPEKVQQQQALQMESQIKASAERLIQALVKAILSLLTGGILGHKNDDSAVSKKQFGNIFQNWFALHGLSTPADTLSVDPSTFVPTQTTWSFQTLMDNLATRFGGSSITGADQPTVNKGLDGIFNTLVHTSQQVQILKQVSMGASESGISYTDSFSDDAGTSLIADWEVNYSGSGTSTIGIASPGVAHWTTVNDASRSAIIRNQNFPTNTDYQYLGATVKSGPDNNGAANYLFARMNSAHTDYVYAKFTCNGFLSYQAELGYCISGTRHTWVSPTSMPIDTNNYLVAGTASGVDYYQIWSGTTLVFSYQDTGHNYTSSIGSTHRYWGWGGDVVVSGSHVYAPGDGVLVTIADHQPPSAVGSGFTAYRSSTSNVSCSGGTNLLPGSFFANVVRQTADLTWDTTTNKITVSIDGWYEVNIKIQLNSNYGAAYGPVLYRNGTAVQVIGGWNGAAHMTGHFSVYLAAGDYVQPGTYLNLGGANATGESTGTWSQLDLALINRSLS